MPRRKTPRQHRVTTRSSRYLKPWYLRGLGDLFNWNKPQPLPLDDKEEAMGLAEANLRILEETSNSEEASRILESFVVAQKTALDQLRDPDLDIDTKNDLIQTGIIYREAYREGLQIVNAKKQLPR